VAQFLLGIQQLGHVGMHADHARDAAFVILHLDAAGQDVDIVPELVPEALDHLEAAGPVLQEIGEPLGDAVAVLAMDQGRPGRERIRQLVLRIAELLLPARRKPQPVLVRPPVPDAVVAAQDGEAEELLPLAQARLDLSFVQVERRQQEAGQGKAGDEAVQADQRQHAGIAGGGDGGQLGGQ
jgi:hypothetical protein